MQTRKMHVISDIWEEMQTEKGDLIERSEAYARWTIPSIMPVSSSSNQEQDKGSVMIGARLVNHLANRLIDVLFPVSRPFFTVALTPEALLDLKKEHGEENVSVIQEHVRSSTSNLEKVALRKLNLTEYRPVAIQAAKHLVITGNALIRRMPSGKRIMYGVNRFGIRRDIEGNDLEIVLYDKKTFATFTPELQELIRTNQTKSFQGQSGAKDEVVLLTHYTKLPDGRWKVCQEADGVNLNNDQTLSEKDYDLLPLTWNLASGDYYGRGLVEDHAATFHQLDVTTDATTDLMAVICDVKFLVKTGSPLAMQIPELNAAPRGAYFPGNEGDITIPELGKRGDLSVMMGAIQKWEQDLSQAFLLSSVRDAERVTAEEIRLIASELESSYGGLYSQLALSWQQKEADYAIEQIDFNKEVDGSLDLFEVLVTTGLESLSREGQVDNLRLAISDLQMMQSVPDDIRAAINPLRFASFIFTNRSVDLKEFLNTPAEMEEAREHALEEAGRLNEQQAQSNVAEHAGKAAVDNQQT
jgi:hypothetical protein